MPTGLLFLIILLSLGGCGERAWRVAVPRQIASIPTDAFFSFRVQAVAGGIKPGPVQTFEARCVDGAICEARVLPPRAPGEFGEIHVIGKQIGSTSVVVDAENPIYRDHERHTIEVMVTAPPARSTIALGSPIPPAPDLLHRADNVDVGRCTVSTGFEQSITGSDRADVHLYACSSYIDVQNQRRFRACGDGLCSAEDSYLLCTQTRSGAVAATAVVAVTSNGFEVKSTEGTFDAGVCTPRK